VVNSFLKQFVRDQEVTFSTKEYKMTPYLESLIEDTEEKYQKGKLDGPFDNADDFIKKLNK
jgi:hypothetical protein